MPGWESRIQQWQDKLNLERNRWQDIEDELLQKNQRQTQPAWFSQLPQTYPQTIPVDVATPEIVTNKDIPWYEQPKVWGEQGMAAVGKAVSKVPVLPDVLEFVS